MSAKDDSDPIANTEMFRAFTNSELEPKKTSSTRTPALVALLVVLVVAVVVIAVLALK
jgi:hypothetical protein